MRQGRTLVIGDIHSGLQALKQLLEKAKVGPKDKLIFLGDYVDGWSEAAETIDFLMELGRSHQCRFIRGNHDELCKAWLLEQGHNPTWLIHGGEMTRQSYENRSPEEWKIHIDFFDRLENYYLDAKNRLFLHAGFTNLKGVEFEYFPELFYWDRTLWELAKALPQNLSTEDVDYPKRLLNYSEIFIGHTPLSKTGQIKPQQRANVWNMDTGAAFKGSLSMMDIDTKEVWQSDPVQSFYPKERGRN